MTKHRNQPRHFKIRSHVIVYCLCTGIESISCRSCVMRFAQCFFRPRYFSGKCVSACLSLELELYVHTIDKCQLLAANLIILHTVPQTCKLLRASEETVGESSFSSGFGQPNPSACWLHCGRRCFAKHVYRHQSFGSSTTAGSM